MNTHVRCSLAAIVLAALSMLTGCATTTVATTGELLMQPLCQPDATPVSAVIYWTPHWRVDQKEPALREAAALRGIHEFIGKTPCLTVTALDRLPTATDLPSDLELQRVARATSAQPDRVVLVAVRELGPRLTIGLPVLVEGGTEVLFQVRVLNLRTGETMANTQTVWRNGGPFVIKGVKTLDHDMSAALRSTLIPGTEAE